jgi:hypothetical protein
MALAHIPFEKIFPFGKFPCKTLKRLFIFASHLSQHIHFPSFPTVRNQMFPETF